MASSQIQENQNACTDWPLMSGGYWNLEESGPSCHAVRIAFVAAFAYRDAGTGVAAAVVQSALRCLFHSVAHLCIAS